MNVQVESIDGLKEVVNILLEKFEEGYSIILLEGELGSGKTTLVQHLCAALVVDEPVTSPTFSIIQEYRRTDGEPVYHMDLYRLERTEELEQIGFREYLDTGHLCLIEWPSIGSPYFTMPYIRVEIEVVSDYIRNFILTTHDAMDT